MKLCLFIGITLLSKENAFQALIAFVATSKNPHPTKRSNKLIISDLCFVENMVESFIVGGDTNVVNQVNIARINQNAVAISYGGSANAANSASIVQSNSFPSANIIKSKARSMSI